MTKEEIDAERRWLRKAQLIYLYHTMRSNRIVDTAIQLNYSTGFISQSITIAKYSERLELGDTCRNRDDALKKIRDAKL